MKKLLKGMDILRRSLVAAYEKNKTVGKVLIIIVSIAVVAAAAVGIAVFLRQKGDEVLSLKSERAGKVETIKVERGDLTLTLSLLK